MAFGRNAGTAGPKPAVWRRWNLDVAARHTLRDAATIILLCGYTDSAQALDDVGKPVFAHHKNASSWSAIGALCRAAPNEFVLRRAIAAMDKTLPRHGLVMQGSLAVWEDGMTLEDAPRTIADAFCAAADAIGWGNA